MAATPLVSVITPSYNQAVFLEKTMRSVLNQDYPSIEYIVVDGGSNDGSEEIIRRYADRLKWWVAEKDQGQADAINKGLGHAEGEIIAWLNSDDFYLAGAVSKVVEAFAAHPECGLIYGDVVAVDGENQPINLNRYGDWQLEDLARFQIIGQPAVFVRREALKKAGWQLDTRFHYMLDHQLWLRIASRTRMMHIVEFLAAARYHENAKNLALSEEFGKDAYVVVDWMKNDPALKEHFAADSRRIMAAVHWFNARYIAVGGKPGKALGSYAKSIALDPQFVLKDWRRFLATLLEAVGIRGLYPAYVQKRQKKILAEIDWDILNP
jgi:glycosyltransferase involved in cell wall biosynthesis